MYWRANAKKQLFKNESGNTLLTAGPIESVHASTGVAQKTLAADPAVQTWAAHTVVDHGRASGSRPARGAGAGESIDLVSAGAAVTAGLWGTVVDQLVACGTAVAGITSTEALLTEARAVDTTVCRAPV